MHPLDEILLEYNKPDHWQIDLIERLQSTSLVTVGWPETRDEANDMIRVLQENQLCPITQIGKYSLTQLNLFIKKNIL